MDIDEQRKYVFKIPYETNNGTIPEGTEIILFHGCVYVNGGLCTNYASKMLLIIINNEALRDKYLVRMKIINNKI